MSFMSGRGAQQKLRILLASCSRGPLMTKAFCSELSVQSKTRPAPTPGFRGITQKEKNLLCLEDSRCLPKWGIAESKARSLRTHCTGSFYDSSIERIKWRRNNFFDSNHSIISANNAVVVHSSYYVMLLPRIFEMRGPFLLASGCPRPAILASNSIGELFLKIAPARPCSPPCSTESLSSTCLLAAERCLAQTHER